MSPLMKILILNAMNKKCILIFLLFFGFFSDNVSANELQKQWEDQLGKQLFLQNFEQKVPENVLKKSDFFIEWNPTETFVFLHFPAENFSKWQPYIFVENPSGEVEKIPFPLVTRGGIGIKKIPILFPQKGKYLIEVLDTSGFPIFSETVFSQNIETKNIPGKVNKKSILSINEERKSLGKTELQEDEMLNIIAKRKLDDMFRDQYVGHISPQGRGILDFFSADERKKIARVGENLATGTNISEEDLQNSLLNSPAHKYVMLFPVWKKIGTAYAMRDGESYLVQIFSY